ncbi:MAG: hypothetical protein N2Z72_05135, partial [Bacteroidales bacterium]|nr:hypothetical protein [Bacteroidales bacterium]
MYQEFRSYCKSYQENMFLEGQIRSNHVHKIKSLKSKSLCSLNFITFVIVLKYKSFYAMKNFVLFTLVFFSLSCKVKVKKIEQPTKDILRENTFTSSSSETLFKIDTVYEKNELL